jgi:hypothetical protein
MLTMSGGRGLVVRSEERRTTVTRPSLSRLRAVSDGPARSASVANPSRCRPASRGPLRQPPGPARLRPACAPGLIGCSPAGHCRSSGRLPEAGTVTGVLSSSRGVVRCSGVAGQPAGPCLGALRAARDEPVRRDPARVCRSRLRDDDRPARVAHRVDAGWVAAGMGVVLVPASMRPVTVDRVVAGTLQIRVMVAIFVEQGRFR